MFNVAFSQQRKSLFIGTILVLFLILILVACSGNSNSAPTTQGTTTSTGVAASGTATPTTAPGIKLGSQPCPDAVKSPSHWDPIVPTQNGVTKVESVTCGNLIGVPALQALVTVRYQGSGATLDIYVYNNITGPSPSQLFKLQNLYKGEARISGYNSVLTAEVDQNSSLNAGKDNATFTQDLFREFKWSDGVGTLVPVSFPGIYPDLTRYQAENDQAQVNQGQDAWKLSAATVASHLAADPNLLKWSSTAPTTVVSGGGSGDTDALVTVKNPAPGGGIIKVALQRLEGNTNGGIWEVVSVTSDGMSITAPPNRDQISNPVKVIGTGNAFEGSIGTVTVLDHLYKDIGHASATAVTGNGATTFSTSVTYNSTFKGGFQEGIVALYAANNAGGPPAAATMIKVLL